MASPLGDPWNVKGTFQLFGAITKGTGFCLIRLGVQTGSWHTLDTYKLENEKESLEAYYNARKLAIIKMEASRACRFGGKWPTHGFSHRREREGQNMCPVFQIFRGLPKCLVTVSPDLECWQNWHVLDSWGPQRTEENAAKRAQWLLMVPESL